MTSLARLITDPDPRQRELALDAIGELDGERAAALISELLHDPDPGVRTAAAAAAARSRAAPVVFSLILCLEDPQSEVRQQARQAIEVITGQDVPGVEAPGPLPAEKVEALKSWWKQRRLEDLASELSREGR
jgi:HEAT repeat protein